MTASSSGFSGPDRSLASRDAALPALSWLLDNSRLSELLGETVRVTRVRYKPGTSLLVAFRRIRNGSFDYGWAYTLAAPTAKLLRRESTSRSRGGNMRVLRPDPGQQDTLVAVGGVEDDWALYKNLLWLRKHGAERLGISNRPGGTLLAGSSVLRYKPERRLVLSARQGSTAVVIKAAAKPATAGQQTHFLDRLRLHGVPLLPQLGDAECLDHGISACVAWGGGDLAGLDDDASAFAAGEALATLHGVADARLQDGAGSWPAGISTQLQATRNMVSSLLPALEEPARRIEAELSALLLNGQPGHVLVHGDFSPDQVLVGGSEVRLIDFDRAHAGTAEADLGSFAAAEETVLPAAGGAPGGNRPARGASAGGPKTAGLVDGYLQAGGRFTQSGVDAWAAFRLFNSSVDPFRDRSPEWAADMSWHLSRARALIP
ncbi:aminoglycoside phosphotransferase family protein [Arthrobacter sp. FW305-BF8]|uniref:aminoglycoside phosphotransferase family protein n=1 Tax=Arthrobacter sp. FW305-BF8 TaxID=2879617 RepID=UPI001F236CBD|nr:aminoglycoside phosphotransferase family protein [Arthrobacter sp. FW305-BF8]UKA53974.1 aminoglycoside phosphotransferase family protein [Arthrobacter sp. FW305-BF8]